MSNMFLPSAKVIIKHPEEKNLILLIKRNVHGELSYEPAGGRAEINYDTLAAENLEECAIREVREEVGVFVSIDSYLGSYSFFWPHDLTKCSSYAVFVGTFLEKDPTYLGNGSNDHWPVEPVWVRAEDIISRKLILNQVHKGLEPIVFKYLKKSCC
jgi:8-oxo-dGTP pyrophosphatase MutT (NUDIX family)